MISTGEFVLAGEAAESEPEDELNSGKKNRVSIIDGEASESDDDIATLNLKPLGLDSSPKHASMLSSCHPDELSLLQSKLVEANLSLYNNLNKFVQTTCQTANKELHTSDKLLQSAQMHLYNATKTIKGVNDSSAQLLEKVNNVLTSNFLLNVKITK